MRKKGFLNLLNLTSKYLVQERYLGIDAVLMRPSRIQNASSGDLEGLCGGVQGCLRCSLGKTRRNLVFGEGDAHAKLLFIGEGPGFDEDLQGRPFVGKAGQLLTKIIESIGLRREKVYITNVVKCHPMLDPNHPERRGNDRPPTPEESSACLPILQKQIGIIQPKIICTLGSSAARVLLQVEHGITKIRGRFYGYSHPDIPFTALLMPTFHPAYLLRNPGEKRKVWEDMKKIREELAK